jgi:hypothetical protein
MSIPKLVIRDNDKEDDAYTSLRTETNNMVSDDRRTKESVRKTVSAQVETIDTTDEAAVSGTGDYALARLVLRLLNGTLMALRSTMSPTTPSGDAWEGSGRDG